MQKLFYKNLKKCIKKKLFMKYIFWECNANVKAGSVCRATAGGDKVCQINQYSDGSTDLCNAMPGKPSSLFVKFAKVLDLHYKYTVTKKTKNNNALPLGIQNL